MVKKTTEKTHKLDPTSLLKTFSILCEWRYSNGSYFRVGSPFGTTGACMFLRLLGPVFQGGVRCPLPAILRFRSWEEGRVSGVFVFPTIDENSRFAKCKLRHPWMGICFQEKDYRKTRNYSSPKISAPQSIAGKYKRPPLNNCPEASIISAHRQRPSEVSGNRDRFW